MRFLFLLLQVTSSTQAANCAERPTTQNSFCFFYIHQTRQAFYLSDMPASTWKLAASRGGPKKNKQKNNYTNLGGQQRAVRGLCRKLYDDAVVSAWLVMRGRGPWLRRTPRAVWLPAFLESTEASPPPGATNPSLSLGFVLALEGSS